MLEAQLHEFSSFWTLTYSDDYLPPGATLVPRDLQLFLKRLRRLLPAGRPIRFFGVGEYGDDTWRPHYHLALFGLASIEVDTVQAAWRMGFCHGGELTLESAQYLAGYVTKKMTAKDDPRLAGRHPEFARMSLRPGIGAGAIPAIADALNDTHGAAYVGRTGDVPAVLRHGSRQLPIGRYLRRRLRDEMGFAEIGGQPRVAQLQAEELRAMSEVEGGISRVLEKKFKTQAVKVQQVEGRAAIWKKRASL